MWEDYVLMKTVTISKWNDLIVPEVGDKLTTEWAERVAQNELYLYNKVIASETPYYTNHESEDNQSNTTYETKFKFKTFIPADRTTITTRVLTDKNGAGGNPAIDVALYINDVLVASQSQTITGAAIFDFEASAKPYADSFVTGEIKAKKDAGTANYDISDPYVYGEI